MTPRIDVRSNIKSVVAEFKRDTNQLIEQAQVTALNRAMVTARAYTARELKKQYGALPVRVIKSQMKLVRAMRSMPRAILRMTNRRIQLIRYGVFQTPRGVRGSGLPKRLQDVDGRPVSAADLAHAFIRRSTKGPRQVNVFLREGKARYPLRIVLAPSISETLLADRIDAGMTKVAIERFEAILRREIAYRLSKGSL